MIFDFGSKTSATALVRTKFNIFKLLAGTRSENIQDLQIPIYCIIRGGSTAFIIQIQLETESSFKISIPKLILSICIPFLRLVSWWTSQGLLAAVRIKQWSLILLYAGGTRFQCQSCRKYCENAMKLERHYGYCTRPALYSCPKPGCRYATKLRYNLYRHARKCIPQTPDELQAFGSYSDFCSATRHRPRKRRRNLGPVSAHGHGNV
jgi:hypothetical protein